MSSGNAALITGASAGLGLEYAKLFAADGQIRHPNGVQVCQDEGG